MAVKENFSLIYCDYLKLQEYKFLKQFKTQTRKINEVPTLLPTLKQNSRHKLSVMTLSSYCNFIP